MKTNGFKDDKNVNSFKNLENAKNIDVVLNFKEPVEPVKLFKFKPAATLVGSYGDILAALGVLEEVLSIYGFVAISDFYDAIGRPDLAVGASKIGTYGWYDLSEAEMKLEKTGDYPEDFYLAMPEFVEIFDCDKAEKNKQNASKKAAKTSKHHKLRIKDNRAPGLVLVKELDKGDLFEWVGDVMMITEPAAGKRWCVNLNMGYLYGISEEPDHFGGIDEETLVRPLSGTLTIEK